jgi:hypothetical protein
MVARTLEAFMTDFLVCTCLPAKLRQRFGKLCPHALTAAEQAPEPSMQQKWWKIATLGNSPQAPTFSVSTFH